jgi:DNA-binding transcriptional ArsR family regulator
MVMGDRMSEPQATNGATDAGAHGQPDAGASAAPERERLVSDVETLKALSDPLRLRILETMVARPNAAWSVKEMATALDVPQTRLYHHVELLLERDLIRVASQRVVSGIIESRYRVAALSFRLDRRFLSNDPSLHAAGRELLHTVFDSARDEVAAALQLWLVAHPDADPAADPDATDQPDRPLLTRGLAVLPPAKAAEFRRRLVALMNEYDGQSEAPGAVPFGFLFALYPAAPTKEPSDD